MISKHPLSRLERRKLREVHAQKKRASHEGRKLRLKIKQQEAEDVYRKLKNGSDGSLLV